MIDELVPRVVLKPPSFGEALPLIILLLGGREYVGTLGFRSGNFKELSCCSLRAFKVIWACAARLLLPSSFFGVFDALCSIVVL